MQHAVVPYFGGCEGIIGNDLSSSRGFVSLNARIAMSARLACKHASSRPVRSAIATLCLGGSRVVVMMYVRFPLSLRNVEDLLFKRLPRLPEV